MILGIDQSFTSTGVVLTGFDKEVRDFQIISTQKNDLDPLDIFKRSIIISDKIAQICDNTHVTELRIEGLGMSSIGNATRNLAQLQYAIISEIIKKHPEIEIKIIAPTSLKKRSTGNGKATKQDMYDALPESVKTLFKDVRKTKGLYDITDAYFLSVF
ncbi:MAG: crossover junction endodeoxyribonuclease RuvC [Thiotrichales bacterium]|jgi:Holliday junction resolvasome RuvABC endonuclease subunit|nr:crossover junction endodeoxyribonuclease RuvC [Thiotrichales bacterium]